MSLRIAEIGEDAVAEISRDETVEAAHRLGHACLIGRHDLAQVFRVHAGGERRRTDQVDEHDRDMAALGGVRHRTRSRRLGGDRGARGRAQICDRLEKPLPVSEEHAELFEIGVGQVRQDVGVNSVLAERGLVLAEPQAPQPGSYVHARDCQSIRSVNRPSRPTTGLEALRFNISSSFQRRGAEFEGLL